jgi:hypothetical protein
MKMTSARTATQKIASLFAGMVIVGCAALAAAGCGGPTADGQHASCDTTADCPTGNALECLTSSDGTSKSCEIPCDPTKLNGTACPLDQTCETQTDFAEPVCFELPE